MPTPSSMTLADAVGEVLARIGQLDDDVANPLLEAEAVAHINAAQRQLSVEYGWLAQRRRILVSVSTGRRWVDLPADAMVGRINRATWVQSSLRTELRCGIVPDDRNLAAGDPAAFDLAPTPGIIAVSVAAGGTGYANGACAVSGGTRLDGGHDPVVSVTVSAGAVATATIEDAGSEWTTAPTLTPPGGGSAASLVVTLGSVPMLELSPVPANAGTLEIEYVAGAATVADAADLLSFDAEAVIGRAAMLLATTKGLPGANGVAQLHALYMGKLSTQQSPGRTTSLSSWRRDDRPRTMLPRRA